MRKLLLISLLLIKTSLVFASEEQINTQNEKLNADQKAEIQFANEMQQRFHEMKIHDKVIQFYDYSPLEQDHEQIIPYIHVHSTEGKSYIHIRRALVGKISPVLFADRIIKYQYGVISRRRQRTFALSTNQKWLDDSEIDRIVRLEIDKSPEQKQLSNSIESIAKVEHERLKEIAKSSPSLGERLMKSINQANINFGYGTAQKNPHPESISNGTSVNLNTILHPLALFPGIVDGKSDDTLFVDVRAGYIQFEPSLEDNKKDRTSLILTVGTNLGNLQVYGRERTEEFTPSAGSPNDPRFQRNYSKSMGFRFSFKDESNPNNKSYAFIDYETFKFSDKPFEYPTIKETALQKPNWPMVKVLNPNSGLLLGYILSVGFVTDLSNQFPTLIPALENIISNMEWELKASLNGSAMGSDDPDAFTLFTAVRMKLFGRSVIALQATYGTDITQDPLRYVSPNEPGMHVRNKISTYTVMFSLPLSDNSQPEEASGKYVPFNGPQKLVVQKFENFNKIYNGPLQEKNRVALYRDGDEANQKVMENGIKVDLAYQNFLFKNILSYVSGKNTELSRPDDGSGFSAIQSQIHYRLTQSSSIYTKIANEGKFSEIGLGFEVTPVKTDRTEVKVYGEREVYSNFPCLVRPNQIVSRAIPNCAFRAGVTAEHDLLKLKFATAAINMNFNLFGIGAAEPKIADWRFGFKVKSRYLTVEVPINNNCIGLGDSTGKDRFSKNGEGKGGGKCNSYYLVTIDLLEIYRALTGKPVNEIPTSLLSSDENTGQNLLNPDKKESEIMPPNPDVELIHYSNSQEKSILLLEEIGQWIYKNPSHPINQSLLNKVPEIIENIAKHNLYVGKYYIDRGDNLKFGAGRERFLQALQLFDKNTDFYRNTIADETLQRVLKDYYSSPDMKIYLQSKSDSIEPEALFCLAQTYKAEGNINSNAIIMAKLQQKYPKFNTNPSLWQNLTKSFREHSCLFVEAPAR